MAVDGENSPQGNNIYENTNNLDGAFENPAFASGWYIFIVANTMMPLTLLHDECTDLK